MITAENRSTWQQVIDSCEVSRPSKGKLVTVTSGKYRGKIGTVLVHMPDKYDKTRRYLSDTQLLVRESRGIEGYVCLVEFKEGGKAWVKANKLILQ